jgi:hypothetical protein
MSCGPNGPRSGRSQLTTARLAAVAQTLQATPQEVDLLYLCDNETTLDRVSRWIGSGPRTTLAGDANVDIMKTIIIVNSVPIICSHFPHGKEHVITCVTRLRFAS